ncbi:MAG: Asparagine synthetase [glutamine-hydrolyzing] 1 [Phycisphaerales bacterium]|nr:Asparagine synthetase [glutamine-hydrolyzing] 1 [Phycisphaerales bacterium]
MCGIAGIFHLDRSAAIDTASLARMSARLAHRGPDGHGEWIGPGVGLAHRRLAVVDATPAGAQPMLWVRDSTGRGFATTWERATTSPSKGANASTDVLLALVYNGELYNDAELRAELTACGVEFRSRSDTETVLAALATWGPRAVDRFRGMYALGLVDLLSQTLLLARDPLGIKPLYYTVVPDGAASQFVFANEPAALLEHSSVPRRPDPVTVSSYLTTIRTTLGERTLFEGIRILEPGQRLIIGRDASTFAVSRWNWWEKRPSLACPSPTVADAVSDSVNRHLRSDVPLCCLLSGGLDSSIVSLLGQRHWSSSTWADPAASMTTFCAGADSASGGSDDFAMARLMAGVLGSRHVEAIVTREMFAERWPGMIEKTGVPLSTPNEIAINEVARRLHAEGFTVALSGEGADELFGGYDSIMTAANDHARAQPSAWRRTGGTFHLNAAAWVSLETKQALLDPGMYEAAQRDRLLTEDYARQFEACCAGIGDDEPLQAHLRFQRRVNLHGLLLRLDQATMLESVEGRTPLADQDVAVLAESLPVGRKFVPATGPGQAARTKVALRDAFAGELPSRVVNRPKASFPLPFQSWVADMAGVLADSPAGREWFTPAAVALVTADPSRAWQLAWPMLNLALWSRSL